MDYIVQGISVTKGITGQWREQVCWWLPREALVPLSMVADTIHNYIPCIYSTNNVCYDIYELLCMCKTGGQNLRRSRNPTNVYLANMGAAKK
jgi:hypothetical protein